MIVRSIPKFSRGAGNCSDCNGHGVLVHLNAFTLKPVGESTCRTCLGTGSVTKEVERRKAAAKAFTQWLSDEDLTIREAAKLCGVDFMVIARARQAEVSVEAIHEVWNRLKAEVEKCPNRS